MFGCWEEMLETYIVLVYHFNSIVGETPTVECGSSALRNTRKAVP